MDLPLRTYSSGMLVRLGFAMATAIRPQILLMDEWFLAGDAEFLERAKQRLEDMVRGAEILVLSTHQTFVVQEWCTRVLWLDQGRIREDGAPDTVLGELSGTSVTAEGCFGSLTTQRIPSPRSHRRLTQNFPVDGTARRTQMIDPRSCCDRCVNSRIVRFTYEQSTEALRYVVKLPVHICIVCMAGVASVPLSKA